jgi:hypothetical protein
MVHRTHCDCPRLVKPLNVKPLYIRHIMRQSHTAPAGKSDYLLRGINRYRILRAELRRGVERYQTGQRKQGRAA